MIEMLCGLFFTHQLKTLRSKPFFTRYQTPVRGRHIRRNHGLGLSAELLEFLQVSEKHIPKSTLSQHFKILREAGLIRESVEALRCTNVSRCAEIDKRFPG